MCIYKGYFDMAYSTVAQILYTLCSSKSIKSRTFWWTTVKVGYYLFQNRHEESWNEHTTEGSLFTWFFNKKVFLLFFYEMYFWSNANMKNEKEIPVKDETPEWIFYNPREKALIRIGVLISKPCSLWIIRFNFIFKLKKIIVYQKAEMASAANISIKATPKPCSLRRS